MRKVWGVGLVILLTTGLTSCGSDKVTAPRKSQLVGIWDATKVEYVNLANSNEKVEIISTGGSGILDLNSDGTFQLIITPYGFDASTLTGTWQLTGASDTKMVFTYPADAAQASTTFNMILDGASLSLTGGELDAGWDFTGDGTLDPVTLNLAFVRAK
jgi:hypothetical protein